MNKYKDYSQLNDKKRVRYERWRTIDPRVISMEFSLKQFKILPLLYAQCYLFNERYIQRGETSKSTKVRYWRSDCEINRGSSAIFPGAIRALTSRDKRSNPSRFNVFSAVSQTKQSPGTTRGGHERKRYPRYSSHLSKSNLMQVSAHRRHSPVPRQHRLLRV